MRRFFASIYRIASRAGFLTVALFLGLCLKYLPNLLTLDEFRPRLTKVLEQTFHCKVLVGGVTGQLIPYPGLIVGHVVFLEETNTPRVLAAVNSVHLWISTKSLLEGRLEVSSIRFSKPRFIAHHERGPSGEARWAVLALPRAEPTQGGGGIGEWLIQDGSVEIWDHMTTPTSKWVTDRFNGSFHVRRQTGAIAGKAAQLGPDAILDLHYDGAATFPVQARFNDVELKALQSLTHMRFFTLGGTSDLQIQARFQPTVEVLAKIDQPEGAGQVTISAHSGTHGEWKWSAAGLHSTLKGTAFELPEWSAKGDAQGVSVYARGTTAEGGLAEVTWNQPAGAKDSALEVDVSSVTIRQVLEIFKLQSLPRARSAGTMNPHGYEPWVISEGSLQAFVHDGDTLEVKESEWNLAGLPTGQTGMHLNLTGSFDLTKTHPQAHIQGSLQNILVAPIVESFFTPPSPLTGTGQATFDLTFPLSADWIQGLSGPFQVKIDNGVLRALKTIYRIMSVLNLGNYLRLRFPQITAKGIVFETITGHFIFQNGVFSSDDLFLKSLNMNVGAKGALDIPQKRITSTLRLEMFRFLEDILRDVPITHWIFKKPNKIFLPLVVTIEGPWDDVDVR